MVEDNKKEEAVTKLDDTKMEVSKEEKTPLNEIKKVDEENQNKKRKAGDVDGSVVEKDATKKKKTEELSEKKDEEKVAEKISGRKIAKELRNALKDDVKALQEANSIAPHLCVFLVGSRKDSQTYVRMKTKACEQVGIKSTQHDLPEDTTQEKLIELVNQMNKDSSVNGILIQLPLPKHIDEKIVLSHVAPDKDVDGLLQINNGDIYRNGVKANLIPCTPLGCIHMLDYHKVQIEGARAVVIGRSALVGKPMALLLLSRNATVTMCHSRTKDIASVVAHADIVVAAVGRPNFVKGSWLKPGCVVIDVGINAVDDPSRKRGYRLVGDVEYAEAKKVASKITPVPGGVGPMTVAMLLNNTIKAFKLQHAKSAQ